MFLRSASQCVPQSGTVRVSECVHGHGGVSSNAKRQGQREGVAAPDLRWGHTRSAEVGFQSPRSQQALLLCAVTCCDVRCALLNHGGVGSSIAASAGPGAGRL